jgi:hypothetical protein
MDSLNEIISGLAPLHQKLAPSFFSAIDEAFTKDPVKTQTILKAMLEHGKLLSSSGGKISKKEDETYKRNYKELAELAPEAFKAHEDFSFGLLGTNKEDVSRVIKGIDEFKNKIPSVYRFFVEQVSNNLRANNEFRSSFDGISRKELIEKNLEKCRPFIIHYNKNIALYTFDGKDEDDLPLDLPFDCCFFEAHGGYLSQNMDTEETLNSNFPSRVYYTMGFMVMEIEPAVVEAIAMEVYVVKDDASLVLTHLDRTSPQLKNLLKYVLNILKNGRYGEESGKKFKFKLGKRSEKRWIKTNNPIHIVPKHLPESSLKEITGTVDWQTRWEVRGHWVRLHKEGTNELDFDRLGKSRIGDRVVRGMTWRSHHIKGPEDKPIIRKTRIIDLNKFEAEDSQNVPTI